MSATPFSGYRFPPDIIALVVRWYIRYRLSYADVAELLAERGVPVDVSTVYGWVREFAPLSLGLPVRSVRLSYHRTTQKNRHRYAPLRLVPRGPRTNPDRRKSWLGPGRRYGM